MAVGLHALLAAGLIPAFAFWAPPGFENMGLLGLLLVISTFGECAEIELRNGIRIDATSAAGLIALVLAGPLLALLVLCAPIVFASTIAWRIPAMNVERYPLMRVGNLSNVASCGWSVLIAGALLHALGIHGVSVSVPAVAGITLCGIVASASQLALGPGVHRTLYRGYRLGEVVRDAAAAAPSDLLMIALGALGAWLLGPLGVVALALFALVVLVPPMVPAHARARPASELGHDEAAALYIRTIAGVMGGVERRELRLVPTIIEVAARARRHLREQRERLERAGIDPDLGPVRPGIERAVLEAWDLEPGGYAAATADERWDGTGPSGVRMEAAPLLARIVPVGIAWAALTAKGGPELSHEQALAELRNEAGTRFDPGVLDVVELIIARERPTTTVPAFQPRAQRLPRLLRAPALALGAQLNLT